MNGNYSRDVHAGNVESVQKLIEELMSFTDTQPLHPEYFRRLTLNELVRNEGEVLMKANDHHDRDLMLKDVATFANGLIKSLLNGLNGNTDSCYSWNVKRSELVAIMLASDL